MRTPRLLGELRAYLPWFHKAAWFWIPSLKTCRMTFFNRPWSKGNNPKTAVHEYLKTHPEFEIDKSIQHKLLITVAPDGYMKRTR